MGVTDIFSTSFLICLAICLLLIGGLFMYFNQKIVEQNHKITSMFDLVSTMAEEVNSVKYQVQLVSGKVGMNMNTQQSINHSGMSLPTIYNGGNVNVNNSNNVNNANNNLIAISEDENDSDDSEDSFSYTSYTKRNSDDDAL